MAVFTETVTVASSAARWSLSSRSVQVRLFLTCWLLYALHFSPFVERELYLTMSLAERHTVHVDPYLDLHPDLFAIPGRGTYMGGNPGASILAAVPYALALPIVNRVAPVRPPKLGEKVSASYREERTNRRVFYERVRQRGLDVHLGVAAMVTSTLFMAPLAALGVVVLLGLLRKFGFGKRESLWLALLFAFGTPMFFRAGTLNLNLVVALLALFSFALVWQPEGEFRDRAAWRYLLGGLLAGWGVLTDYSGVVPASLLGLFVLAQEKKGKRFLPALKTSIWYLAGAIGPVLFLLYYQWYCYGSPWWPAQFHQPKIYYQGYPSPRGVGRPLLSALWGLLFDPLYGLFVFAPIFALALYHPILIRRRQNRVPSGVATFCWVFSAALWVFFSCIHYTVRHQWQEGFRYLVPVIPFLFLLVADVLLRIPRVLAYLLAFAAVAETWCLAMVREDPFESLMRVLLRGFELPWLSVLTRTAPQYLPELAQGASPIPLLLACGVLVWAIWRVRNPWQSLPSGSDEPS